MEPKIRVDLFDEAVALLSAELTIDKWAITKTSEEHFRRNFGDEIGEFFINHSYTAGYRFGSNTFEQVRFLHGENFKKHNREIYKQGYYIIGRGLREDLIVLNLHTNTIGFIDSDLFYRHEELLPIDQLFKDTHLDLGTFYYRSITESDSFVSKAAEVEPFLLQNK